MRRAISILAWMSAAACGSSSKGGDGGAPAPERDAAAPDDAGLPPDSGEPPDSGVVLPYTIQAFDRARISSNGADPNFHRVRSEIDLAGAPFTEVRMVLDLGTTCFPFETWRDNPPPPGQNWPADCDAFDRNLEVTLDPARTSSDAPGVELVRAITPFGGPMTIEVDVTDVANGLPGRRTVEVLIPTYSDGAGQVTGSNGGWDVSLRFEVTPGPAPRTVLAVVPIVNRSHDANTSTVTYTIEAPPGTEDARIEYRVTGHGGGQPVGRACIGPAEEFCRRIHRLFVDGELAHELPAWREDCDDLCTLAHFGPADGGFDYCMENPCGAIRSVRAPRANWCPGSVTPPVIVTPDALRSAGSHTFEYAIDTVLPGGVWRISATFFAFGR